MKKTKSITYKEALRTLEEIIDELQGEDVDVDELSQKVKTATELIKVCKEKINLCKVCFLCSYWIKKSNE